MDRAWRLALLAAVMPGCGDVLNLSPAIRFTLPLSINGRAVGAAIIDTGGDYELMLADDHGLPVIDETEVLIFGGRETVRVVGGFDYTVGGVRAIAQSAIVGVPICQCNGLGFSFFRKTGMTLRLDFASGAADFLTAPPDDGLVIPFDPPPGHLPAFDSAFVRVVVFPEGQPCDPAAEVSGEVDPVLNTLRASTSTRREGTACLARRLAAIVDSGAAETLIRRGLVDESRADWIGRVPLVIQHGQLGTVHVSARLYDNPGLPDMIVGTNVMRAWSTQWHFTYLPQGGWITAYPRTVVE